MAHGIELVSSVVKSLTLALCVKYRDMPSLNNERQIRPTRVIYQARLIEQGRFFNLLWGEVLCQGRILRVNGNHTSHVLACCMQAHREEGLDSRSQEFYDTYLKRRYRTPEELPEVKDDEFNVFVETFSVERPEDLIHVFQRYDAPQSTRNNEDMLGVYAGEHVELRDKTAKQVKQVVGGIVKAIKVMPEVFGYEKGEHIPSGRDVGELLRSPKVLECTNWIIESVEDGDLYAKPIGAQVCAEAWAQFGPIEAEKVLDILCNQIQNDEEPGASFYGQLYKKRAKPTAASILKKGRTAVRIVHEQIEQTVATV